MLLLLFSHPFPGYTAITSRDILQNPVDYALAGEQDEKNKKTALEFRSGRAQGRALRHTFGE